MEPHQSSELLDSIYAAVGAQARLYEEELGDRFSGFVILHSPFVQRPRILVLGDQPNGSPGDRRTEEERPPGDDDNSLRRGRYQLALMATAIFDRAERLTDLDEAQFFDTNFFRPLYDDDDDAIRLFEAQNEEFCAPFVKRLVHLIQPQRIVTLGRKPLTRLVPAGSWTKWGMLKVMRSATDLSFEGIPITPLVHLSGQGSKRAHFDGAIDRLQRDLH